MNYQTTLISSLLQHYVSMSVTDPWSGFGQHEQCAGHGPSSTCEFAVGLHVFYSGRDGEHPARRALDLDVRVSLYKGLGYPDTKTANDRTLKPTWKPGNEMCC
jgi:hypothetical protein